MGPEHGAGALAPEGFRLAMRHAAIGQCLVAPDGSFLEVNPALCALLGRDAASLTSSTWQQLTHPDDVDVDLGLVGDVIAGRRDSYRLLKRYLRPDGSIVWGDLSVSCVRDDDGRVRYFVSQIVDATARVTSEQALVASQERFRLLAEHASDVVVQVGADRLIQWVAPSVTRVTGLNPDAFLGRDVSVLLAPESIPGFDDAWTAAAAMSQPLPVDVTVRLRGRDGSARWFSGTLAAARSEQGPGVLVLGLRDVGELVSAREEQTLLAVRQRAMLDAERDPQSMLRPVRAGAEIVDYEIVDTNPAFAALAGLPRDRLIGARLRDLFPPQVAARGVATYTRALVGGEVVESLSSPLPLTIGQEQTRLYDVRAVRVGDGVMVTARDVTERETTLAALAESREQYRLLAEHATDFVARMGPDRRVRWVSPNVARVLGWEPAEVIGKRLEDFADPATDTSRYPERDAVYAGHDVVPGSGRIFALCGRDGASRLFVGRPVPVVDADGRPDGVVAGFKDVTDLIAARDEAAANWTRLRAAVDSELDPHVLLSAVRDALGTIVDFTYADANPAAAAYLGMSVEHIVGSSMLQGLPGMAAAGLLSAYGHAVETGEPVILDDFSYDNEIVGSSRRYDIRGVKVADGLSLTWRDITERYEQQQAVARSEAFLRTAMAAAPIGMSVHDLTGRCQSLNDAMCRILGRTREEALELRFDDVLKATDQKRSAADVKRLLSGEIQVAGGETLLERPDGTIAWIKTAASVIPSPDGTPSRLLVQAEDITAERAATEQLAYQAFHDPLTGLRNRAWLMDMLEVELRSAVRVGSCVGLLFIDLDNFKVINDSLGHAAGDHVLMQVADGIRSVLRPGDHASRFGGDEFVVLVTDAGGPADVERVASRVSTAIGTELVVQGHRMIPTASIGIAVAHHGSTAAELLRDADAALFRAKSRGRHRWQFFDAAMHDAALARVDLETQIRHGLDNGQFAIHYQPIVDLGSGVVAGHEALLRWNHPTRGLLPAFEFIDVAEDSGLIVPLGRLAQDLIFHQLGRRSPHGWIAYNASAAEVSDTDWARHLAARLRANDVDPGRLVVEVTETAALNLLDTTTAGLHDLRDLGVGIHVDDFGTGFSSISLLRELPVTGIKLDRSFVADLTATDSAANALAGGLAGLAHGLRLTAIAEGIENVEQSLILARQGWTHGQGNFFGTPARL